MKPFLTVTELKPILFSCVILNVLQASRTLTAGRFINEKEVGGFKMKVLLNEANFQKFIQNAMREHYNGFNQEDFQEESPASHCMFFQDFADVAAMIWVLKTLSKNDKGKPILCM